MSIASASVSADAVSALLTDIEQLGFYKLNDAYGRLSKCNDCYQYQLTVNGPAGSKTVTAVPEAPDMPPALTQIIEKINTVLATLPK